MKRSQRGLGSCPGSGGGARRLAVGLLRAPSGPACTSFKNQVQWFYAQEGRDRRPCMEFGALPVKVLGRTQGRNAVATCEVGEDSNVVGVLELAAGRHGCRLLLRVADAAIEIYYYMSKLGVDVQGPIQARLTQELGTCRGCCACGAGGPPLQSVRLIGYTFCAPPFCQASSCKAPPVSAHFAPLGPFRPSLSSR